MIVTEQLVIGGRNFIRTYSNKGVKIHGGYPEGDYSEAIDLADSGRLYVETDIPIKDDLSDSEAFDIIFGGAE